MSKHTVTAIVPAYNEEKTVAYVVNTLLSSPLVDEVICVNDGSEDNTIKVLKEFQSKIKTIDIKENKGKGNALAEGIKHAKGVVLLFLDADLTAFTNKHIETLLEPLINGDYRAVLGRLLDFGGFILSDITGQRAYYKQDLLPHLSDMRKTRYGVEVFMNRLIKKSDVKKVTLVGLKTPSKYTKHDPKTAIDTYIKEVVEIAKVITDKKIISDKNLKILKELEEYTDFDNLKKKIKEISDIEVREFLEKYILVYMRNSAKKKSQT